MIIKNCKNCNKEFKIHNYRKDTAFYCSIGCSKKGQIPYNKKGLINDCIICDKEFSVQPATQDSKFCSYKCYWKSLLGVHKETSTTFKKGRNSQFKGLKRPKNSGKNHPLWKGGITKENHKVRTSLEYKLWVKSCLERDNFTCQKTGQKGGELEVHHINNFSNFLELRTSIENGITLSKISHKEFHKKYGYKNNSREQLIEFLNN